jgi:predicted TIM-barrel fold metal-dependent hydrolase
MEPMWHPSWEPFWQAVDEVQLPLHFHTFPTTPPRARQEAPQVRRAAMFTGVSAFQMGLIHIIAGMIGAGVFDRYPRLKVSFGESGAGWLAYALHRMDFEFEDRFRDLMKLRPSEYWRRQCKATFQFDPISAKLIDEIGVETMMWGSDYPHTDGIWPESSKYIEEQFAGLSPEIVHKITCENAAKFLRVDQLTPTLTLPSPALTRGLRGRECEGACGAPQRHRWFCYYCSTKQPARRVRPILIAIKVPS